MHTFQRLGHQDRLDRIQGLTVQGMKEIILSLLRQRPQGHRHAAAGLATSGRRLFIPSPHTAVAHYAEAKSECYKIGGSGRAKGGYASE